MGNPLFGGRGGFFNPYNYQDSTTNAASAPMTNTYSNRQNVPAVGYNQMPQNGYGNQGQQPMNTLGSAMQTMIPQSSVIWIKNMDEINNYPIGRGWQQWFVEENEPYAYIRESDANGIMQPLRKIRLEEVPISQPSAVADVPMQQTPVEYNGPSREEFEGLSEAVKNITAMMEKLNKALE